MGGLHVYTKSITSSAQILWNWLDPERSDGGQLHVLCVAQACIVAALGDWIVRCRCDLQTSEEQREHEDVAHLLSPRFVLSNMRQKGPPLNSKGATEG